MATIQSLTKERILQIEAASVVDGEIDSTNHIILITHDGSRIDIGEPASSSSSPSTLIQQVKNISGSTLTKGTAVYVSGATGTNATISKAQANSEITSSKTLGLLTTDILNGENGYVLVEGNLSGLNTSLAANGDSVWLSPTVAGGLVYGAQNKPVAPNHMVFIGYVIRSNNSNGEIYVRVQNGFELDELHDVKIVSPINGDVIQRTANNLWENKSLSAAGISQVGHIHAIGDVTNLSNTLSLKQDISDSGWLTSGITAATGWSITAQSYRRLNGYVCGTLNVTRTGAAISVPATGNIANTDLATLPSGYYNTTVGSGQVIISGDGPLIVGVVTATGLIVLTAASSGAVISQNITLTFTFSTFA
jgi:hypothetical protein